MSEANGYKTLFFGVSNTYCNNRKLFEYVEDNQKTNKTALEFSKRIEGGSEESIIGFPVNTLADGSVDMISLMSVQQLWDEDEHAQTTIITPRIYFL